MSSLKLVPEITINDVDIAEAGIFIFPGGDMWEQNSYRKLINLLHRLHSKSIPIAAICGATWKIARAGLTNNVHHTSNSQEYLKAKFPNY